jgi:hypothetical protein
MSDMTKLATARVLVLGAAVSMKSVGSAAYCMVGG